MRLKRIQNEQIIEMAQQRRSEDRYCLFAKLLFFMRQQKREIRSDIA